MHLQSQCVRTVNTVTVKNNASYKCINDQAHPVTRTSNFGEKKNSNKYRFKI